MNAERILFWAVAIVCCFVNYYVGKARGAAEERDRLMRRGGEYDD